MTKIDIIRSWKDESYRLSLGEAERAALPENPAGPMELSDAELTGAGAAASVELTYQDTSFCTCNTKSNCVTCIWC